VIEAPKSPFIQFDNVEVQYGKVVYGLRGVSLCVDQGEFVFFVGKTGAGKSTVLKLLTREVRDYTGSVKLAGKEMRTYKDRHISRLRRTM